MRILTTTNVFVWLLKEAAETEHGIMVQDTAWEGYEEIPTWIMQGYGTLALEADHQLEADELSSNTYLHSGRRWLTGRCSCWLLRQQIQRESADHDSC